MHTLQRRTWMVLGFSWVALFIPFFGVKASPLLVKGNGPAVYFLGGDSMRHAFPNEVTFNSWYGGVSNAVLTLPQDQLAAIPLGKNVLIRPGERLVKITTDPKVYAVSQNGTLRWITTEALANELYGASWNRHVSDLPDTFFSNYQIGPPITSASGFNPAAELAQATSPAVLFPTPSQQNDGWMNADQKRRAMEITSVFENSTPVFSYDSVENLNDGRGYTAGRAGFTTGTGDAKDVIARYTARVPNNPLAKYLARVQQFSDAESGSVSGLEGYPDAWKKAAQDPLFRQAQDQVVDEMYYTPAMEDATRLGVKSALGRAIFFDTIIQHGGGDSSDSLSGIERRTTNTMGGTPASGVDESKWLKAFLASRRYVLMNAADAATRAAWAESVTRVDALSQILDEKNLNLNGPIILHLPYDNFILA